MQHLLFLLTWNTFSCSINKFLSIQDYFLCNIKLLVRTKKYFSFNTKFFFLTSFRLLCQSDIFLLSHGNKVLIKCQKINKISFLCGTKKKFLFFKVHHNFFIFSFYITHCQHGDLLHSGLRNKETFNRSFTHLPDVRSSY